MLFTVFTIMFSEIFKRLFIHFNLKSKMICEWMFNSKFFLIMYYYMDFESQLLCLIIMATYLIKNKVNDYLMSKRKETVRVVLVVDVPVLNKNGKTEYVECELIGFTGKQLAK